MRPPYARSPAPARRVAILHVCVAVALAPAATAEPAPARPSGPGRGTLRGTVNVSRRGAPPAGATARDPQPILVYLVGFAEPPPTAPAEIIQRDKRFSPGLLGITAGQRVAFPNGDPFYHNVFSPSPVREFDLGQYRSGQTRARLFPIPGVVDVYCNIHPRMSATILVLPNRRFATARPDGSFTIHGVPAGRWTAYAYSRRAEKPVGATVEIRAGTTTDIVFRIVENRAEGPHRNKYGEAYRDPARYR